MKNKFPLTVIVFVCIPSEYDIMSSHIFVQSSRLNSDGYVEMLNILIKLQLERMAFGKVCVAAKFRTLSNL